MNNPLIFGKNDEQNIVNLTLKADKLHIYKEKDGVVTSEIIPYSPWVLTNKKARPYSERLKGTQYWSWITTTTCEKFNALQGTWNRSLWIPRSIEECATLTEGFTLFKGMKVNDVSILSFDIEGAGLVMDETSEVYIIACTLRKGSVVTKKLFALDDYADSCEMIDAFCQWVREVDPTVLCGHNIFSYDLPYLCHVYGHELRLGRDGSTIVFDTKVSRFRKDGSQEYDYHNARVTGREIVDTFFLSMKYDQAAREFPSYGLKPVIKFLGLEKSDRVFVDPAKTYEYYVNRHHNAAMWNNLKTYSLDDSEDALKLYDKMIPAYFYLTQSVPKSLQQMINEATGSQLDSLMIRSYLQDGYSQPRTSGKVEFEGAISMGIPGVYDWVFKADVSSLYPSIMLENNIHDPKKDPKNHTMTMLKYFRDERLKYKAHAKKTGDEHASNMSEAWKILINSLYGFMGAGYLLYNFPEGASEVTRHGRDILLKAVEWATGHTLKKVIKKVKNKGTEDEENKYEWILDTSHKVCQGKGFTLVNTDTDSFSATTGRPIKKAEFDELLKELNSLYPSLISWEDDSIYEKVIVVRAKNYVLKKSPEYLKLNQNPIKTKGSSLTDQKKEPALIEMLNAMIDEIMVGRPNLLPAIYEEYVKEAYSIRDINRWAKKITVTKSILDPKRANEQKPLDAINETVKKGVIERVSEGDKVWLYTTVDGQVQKVVKGEPVFYKDGTPNMIPNVILRDVRLFNNDAYTKHYINRVYDTLLILENVIDLSQFTDFTVKRNAFLLNSLTNVKSIDSVKSA